MKKQFVQAPSALGSVGTRHSLNGPCDWSFWHAAQVPSSVPGSRIYHAIALAEYWRRSAKLASSLSTPFGTRRGVNRRWTTCCCQLRRVARGGDSWHGLTRWSAKYVNATSLSVLSRIWEIREIVRSRGLLLGVIGGGWAGNGVEQYEKSSRRGLSLWGVGERMKREYGRGSSSGEAGATSARAAGDEGDAPGVVGGVAPGVDSGDDDGSSVDFIEVVALLV